MGLGLCTTPHKQEGPGARAQHVGHLEADLVSWVRRGVCLSRVCVRPLSATHTAAPHRASSSRQLHIRSGLNEEERTPPGGAAAQCSLPSSPLIPTVLGTQKVLQAWALMPRASPQGWACMALTLYSGKPLQPFTASSISFMRPVPPDKDTGHVCPRALSMRSPGPGEGRCCPCSLAGAQLCGWLRARC